MLAQAPSSTHSVTLLLWAPTLAASAHIFEEFVWPGGFLDWHRGYRPQHAASITPRFALIANALLLFLCIAAPVNGPTPLGVAEWLVATAILATNAVFHVRAVLQTRAYSPGVVTAVFLYVPLTLGGTFWLIHTGLASIATAAALFLAGGAYPFLSVFLHRRRSRARILIR